jgi:threonine synthase
VGNPSNFERLTEVFGGSWQAMASRIEGGVVSDERTLETMRRIFTEHRLMVDPHTAVGCAAALDHLDARASHAGHEGPVIVLSTADPAKFGATVREATGADPALPERLARCLSLPKQARKMGTRLTELSAFLLDSFGGPAGGGAGGGPAGRLRRA